MVITVLQQSTFWRYAAKVLSPFFFCCFRCVTGVLNCVFCSFLQYYRDNLKHLLAWDVTIAVKVIHAERPFQLLFQSTTRRHAQSTDKLTEVNRSVTICIKCSEDVFCKPRGIAVWKEVAINLLEFLYCQMSRRTILHSTRYSVQLLFSTVKLWTSDVNAMCHIATTMSIQQCTHTHTFLQN